MKYLRLLLPILGLSSCSFNATNSTQVQVFEVRSSAEVFNPEQNMPGPLEKLENSIKIVEAGENTLYLAEYEKTKSKLVLDGNNSVVNQKVLSVDTTYLIFATSKNIKGGIKYTLEGFRKEQGVVVDMDSILRSLILSKNQFKPFCQELGKPESIIKKGTKTLEKYVCKKASPADPDSIYREYDTNLRSIDFSFCEKLDKEKDSKLCKTTFILNKIPKGVLLPDAEIPRRVMWNEMRRIEGQNKALFAEIIEKFKKDKTKLGLN